MFVLQSIKQRFLSPKKTTNTGMNRAKNVLNILNELAVFYTDLNRLITEYESLPFVTQVQQGFFGSLKLATYQKYLYVCNFYEGVYR